MWIRKYWTMNEKKLKSALSKGKILNIPLLDKYFVCMVQIVKINYLFFNNERDVIKNN